MANFFIFVAGFSGLMWLTAFVNCIHLSKIPEEAKQFKQTLIICIVSTVVAGAALTAYAAITNF